MGRVAHDILIRPPLFARVWGGAVSVLFVGFGSYATIRSVGSGSSGAAFGLVWCTMAVLIGGGAQFQRVRASGDELHVRNFIRDHVYQRRDIDCFLGVDPIAHRSVNSPRLLGRHVVVKLHDGRVLPLFAASRGPFGQTNLGRWLNSLNAWAAAGAAPPPGP